MPKNIPQSDRTKNLFLKAVISSVVSVILVSSATASSFRSGVGIGVQYGGVVGWQGSYRYEDWRLRVGAGLGGVTIGLDYYLVDKVTIGLQTFAVAWSTGSAATINYHFSSPVSPGWNLGLDITFAHHSGWNSDDDDYRELLLSTGYTF